ncbi:MAG TPA: hypothetical protein EYH54_05100 [Nautiliaceae bacterium]|nr:hypothetical protein [Nautiliaceae bacterium]
MIKLFKSFWKKIFLEYYYYLLDSFQKDKEKIKLLYGKNLREFLKKNLMMLFFSYFILFIMIISVYLVYPNNNLLLLALLVALLALPQNVFFTIKFFIEADFESFRSYLNKKTYIIALDIYQFINLKNFILIFENLSKTEEDKKIKKLFEYIRDNLKRGKEFENILSNLYKLFGESAIGNFLRDLEISSYEGQVKEYLQNYIDSFFYTFDERLRKYIGVLNSTLSSILTTFILVNTILVFYYLIFSNLGDALRILNIQMPEVDLKKFYQIATFLIPPLLFFIVFKLEESVKNF